jgi:hypothetical protein
MESPMATAYDRKKYVWKLLYIYMLGYDIEFGHKQACDLIPASKYDCIAWNLCRYINAKSRLNTHRYSEKQVGYMSCSLLLNEVILARDALLYVVVCANANQITLPPERRLLTPGHQCHPHGPHQPKRVLPVPGAQLRGQRCGSLNPTPKTRLEA